MSNKEGEGRKSDAKRGKSRTSHPSDVVRWVNPSPNSRDREWLESNDDSLNELLFTLLEGLTSDGRLTVKYDGKSTRWVAILFIPSSHVGTEFDAMSVRGATAIDAVFLLAYFHLVRFAEGWEITSSEDRGRWG